MAGEFDLIQRIRARVATRRDVVRQRGRCAGQESGTLREDRLERAPEEIGGEVRLRRQARARTRRGRRGERFAKRIEPFADRGRLRPGWQCAHPATAAQMRSFDEGNQLEDAAAMRGGRGFANGKEAQRDGVAVVAERRIGDERRTRMADLNLLGDVGEIDRSDAPHFAEPGFAERGRNP